MRIETTLTDAAILDELGRRLERRRLDLERTQAELAQEAGVGKRTLERIESGGAAQLSNVIRLLRALDLLDRLEALVPETAPTPFQLLQSQRKERQRVRHKTRAFIASSSWAWKDDE